MALSWPAVKDPDEIKDYRLDWTDLLDGDTISSSMWSVAAGTGLVIDGQSNTATSTLLWLSSGTLGETYDLLNRVVTAGGRTYDQTVKLKVRAK